MDNEKQKDEIIALESIYNKEEFSYHEENHHYQCTFKIFIKLPTEYHVTYKNTKNLTEAEEKIHISHLPPLSLFVTLPDNYPSVLPPKFTLCSLWLHQSALVKLCKKLDKLWEENQGQEILFLWVAFLQDETLECLNIINSLNMNYAYTCYKMALERAQVSQRIREKEQHHQHNVHVIEKTRGEDVQIQTVEKRNSLQRRNIKKQKYRKTDKRAIVDCPIGRNPIQTLIDYNEKRNQIEFKKNIYNCKICYMDKLGEHCTKFLPCSHVFCKDCINDYLAVRIKDGTVQNIGCPEEKCSAEATPAQIKDIVSPELFTKYDSILLSATLDTMMDIVYCPRRQCQYPVSREPNEQMASCPVCQYTFCVYCKMVYHGVEPCKVNSAEKQQLVNEYQAASIDKKHEMEQRYGKKQLQVLVENTMSENWINTNSHNCPHCNAAIEKSDGCNKMTCWRCNTFFCWLCGARLNPERPYLHFQNTESKCFNMLYHGVITDEPNDDDDDDDDDDEDDDNDDDDDDPILAMYLDYDSEGDDLYNNDFIYELYI